MGGIFAATFVDDLSNCFRSRSPLSSYKTAWARSSILMRSDLIVTQFVASSLLIFLLFFYLSFASSKPLTSVSCYSVVVYPFISCFTIELLPSFSHFSFLFVISHSLPCQLYFVFLFLLGMSTSSLREITPAVLGVPDWPAFYRKAFLIPGFENLSVEWLEFFH